MLYWVPCSCIGKGGTSWGSKMKKLLYKNTCIHKFVAFKPCHLKGCHCLSTICHKQERTLYVLNLCLHDHIWLTINKPHLSKSHIVIRQHTDTAIGIIDKDLNPQWATAMRGWDGCAKGCRCRNGRTRVQSPHYDADKSAWCNSQWMTH